MSIKNRVAKLEKRFSGAANTEDLMAGWTEFLKQIMPEGADWDIEAEARILASGGLNVNRILSVAVGLASNKTPVLPCMAKRRISNSDLHLPPSQWGRK
jgi:hypothetical protein